MRGAALSAIAVIAATRPSSSPTSRHATAAEARRIQTHLDSALALLATNDTNGLTERQRTRRHAAVETLRAYRDRGVFPHNYDFAGLTPYFVDRKTGTLCAVAELLSSTGRNDIVARVAHANNNVRVRQLAGDTAFTRWLDENGLSLDEAAFIQVVYASPSSTVGLYAGMAATLVALPTLTTGVWDLTANWDGHRPWVNRIGLVAGLVSLGAGTQLRVSPGPFSDSRGYANANMAIGASGVALAIHGMTHHARVVAREQETSRRAITDATVSPIMSSDHSRTGVAVSLHF